MATERTARRPASLARPAAMQRRICGLASSKSRPWIRWERVGNGSCRATARQDLKIPSSGDEFIPLADHVIVFVHPGVPAGDGAPAVFIGAAVARSAGLFENGAVRRLDVVDRRLAFHPVAPFV